MHLKPLLLAATLSITTVVGHAQSATPPGVRNNQVYLELGGSLGSYSLNYERTIPLRNGWGLALSGGIMPKSPGFLGDDTRWGFNGAVKSVYQHGKNRFTAGLGYSHFVMNMSYPDEANATMNDTYLFAQLGYNRVTASGFTWGVHYTPLASLQYSDFVFYWPAVQVGYRF